MGFVQLDGARPAQAHVEHHAAHRAADEAGRSLLNGDRPVEEESAAFPHRLGREEGATDASSKCGADQPWMWIRCSPSARRRARGPCAAAWLRAVHVAPHARLSCALPALRRTRPCRRSLLGAHPSAARGARGASCWNRQVRRTHWVHACMHACVRQGRDSVSGCAPTQRAPRRPASARTRQPGAGQMRCAALRIAFALRAGTQPGPAGHGPLCGRMTGEIGHDICGRRSLGDR